MTNSLPKLSEYLLFTKLCNEGKNPYDFIIEMSQALREQRQQLLEKEQQSAAKIEARE